ncbi:MAG: DUF1573 domain-containing protein [Desulfobacterium sp.]|nr:DUF1573 domain-containing protein [Desulfobacterium sp.]
MKGMFKTFVFVLFLFFSVASLSFSADTTKENSGGGQAPAVFFPAPEFQFTALAEGEDMCHDFVIMNKGTEVLQVRDVKSTCGCTTVSYSKTIPPGGTGIISMKVDTRGYGGKNLRKSIAVLTNDTATPEYRLTVSGPVKKFVTIDPPVLRFRGKIGDKLESVVNIIPERKYPFSITKIRARNGKNIRYELSEKTSTAGAKEYSVTVANVKKDAGSYYDVLILETDSKIQPEIKISVAARLVAPNAPGTKNPAGS